MEEREKFSMEKIDENWLEKMKDCPSQQGYRCSMNGMLCLEKNCTPCFIYQKEQKKEGEKDYESR